MFHEFMNSYMNLGVPRFQMRAQGIAQAVTMQRPISKLKLKVESQKCGG